jgi:hypothetical protein
MLQLVMVNIRDLEDSCGTDWYTFFELKRRSQSQIRAKACGCVPLHTACASSGHSPRQEFPTS